MNLSLTRPLVVFDLETTGINIQRDRIVEISMLKAFPNGDEELRTYRVNPTIPIPREASEIHGIYDKDVADKPTFKDLAKEIEHFLHLCDFGGFNSNKFDFPLLVEEFYRAEIEIDIENRKFIDVQRIFHTMEPRNLSAAYRFYCNQTLEDAHSAEADTIATWNILKAQLDRYPQLPNDVKGLHEFSGQGNNVDLAGRLVFDKNKVPVFNFGKHRGKPVTWVLKQEPSYYNWMMDGDFPPTNQKGVDEITLRNDEPLMKPTPISIIEETSDWVCVHKPPYVPSMPERGKYTAQPVIEWAKNRWDTAILCHRIDRETSGIMILAKTQEAHRHISMQFEHRQITKRYHAIVDGPVHFNNFEVNLPINTLDLNHIRIDRKNGKDALTRFHTLQEFRHFSLIECMPKTGRLHQIRVHLSSQNAKISGDELYGSQIPMLSKIKRKLSGEDRPLIERFALHAHQLEFKDLNGDMKCVVAPYAKDFDVFLKLLNKYDL